MANQWPCCAYEENLVCVHVRRVIALKKHMKAKETWYTAQLPLQWLPEQSDHESVCVPHRESPVSHVPVALKHVVAPLMPTFAPKESVRPDTRKIIAVAAPMTISATYSVFVTRGGVVHRQLHALQQAVHAAAPRHEPTHEPTAAIGAEMRAPIRVRAFGVSALVCFWGVMHAVGVALRETTRSSSAWGRKHGPSASSPSRLRVSSAPVSLLQTSRKIGRLSSKTLL